MMRVQVTDHAVLRWLERECDVPVEAIRKAIADGCNPYVDMAPVSIKIGRIKFVVSNGKVVTTLKRDAPKAARKLAE